MIHLLFPFQQFHNSFDRGIALNNIRSNYKQLVNPLTVFQMASKAHFSTLAGKSRLGHSASI
jgi:hypothetical protein